MNKLTNTAITACLLSTFAMAGGDIDPQEPNITIPEVMEDPMSDNNFYVGLGYSFMKLNNDTADKKVTGNAITALAGYNFHKYFAVEGRYTATLGDLRANNTDNNWDMSNLALFLKPKYAVNELTLYGLLGYGQVSLDDGTKYSEDGFQWGLGASYAATDLIDIFVDYTRLYDDSGFDGLNPNDDFSSDSFNLGLNYNF
jgi:opacity protein-like surface antigen